MSCEIERKFLVTSPLSSILRLHPNHRKITIEQSYLSKSGDWTTRIRSTTCNTLTEYWLTLKKKISDVSCVEIETQIDSFFYTKMQEHCGPALTKIRHEIDYCGDLWEVDLFTNPTFDGLVVAEIELESESSPFRKPPWLGLEVTSDRNYKNARMVKRLLK